MRVIVHVMEPRLTFLSIPEAAVSLGLAQSTLRKQIKNGKLTARRIGRDWFVTIGEVERYRLDHRKDAA
jgi:excisionase family DNA binding protein